MKKVILLSLLALTTGCTLNPILSAPYEVRYFKADSYKDHEQFKKICSSAGIITSGASNFFGDLKIEFLTSAKVWYYEMPIDGVVSINKDTPYYIFAKSKDKTYSYLSITEPASKYADIRNPVEIRTKDLSTCTFTEKAYKALKQKEKDKANKAAKIAAQKEAAKAAAEKRAVEKEAARKNNAVLAKYGKPLCNPYEAGDSDEVNMLYYNVTEKKKNCLFMKKFKVSQTVSDGFLAYTTTIIGWSETTQGPYFIVKNKNDADVVDDEEITGLFEYIGTYSYDSVMGPKKVLKFKHVR